MGNDIFAPYEIAKQLKELEFKEPCIAYYKPNITYTTMFNHYYGTNYDKNDIITAPIWEQVFKWFREKGIYSEILFDSLGIRGNIITFDKEGLRENCYLKLQETYEQARENLTLELIELYKKQ